MDYSQNLVWLIQVYPHLKQSTKTQLIQNLVPKQENILLCLLVFQLYRHFPKLFQFPHLPLCTLLDMDNNTVRNCLLSFEETLPKNKHRLVLLKVHYRLSSASLLRNVPYLQEFPTQFHNLEILEIVLV